MLAVPGGASGSVGLATPPCTTSLGLVTEPGNAARAANGLARARGAALAANERTPLLDTEDQLALSQRERDQGASANVPPASCRARAQKLTSSDARDGSGLCARQNK